MQNEIKTATNQLTQHVNLAIAYLSTFALPGSAVSNDAIGSFLLAGQNKLEYLSDQDGPTALAAGILVDVSFMIAKPGNAFRIPLLYSSKNLPADYANLLKNIAADHNPGSIRALIVDVHPQEFEKREALLTLEFERFCTWYIAPIATFNGQAVTRNMSTEDAAGVAAITNQVRLERQKQKPQLWTLAADAQKKHQQYMETLIPKATIARAVVTTGSQLAVFAIAEDTSFTFPIGVPCGVPQAPGKILVIDDFQADCKASLDLHMFGLLSDIGKLAQAQGYQYVGFVCSSYDHDTEAFLRRNNCQVAVEWLAKGL